MNNAALILENVSKHFGSFRAVDDVSLEVPRGSIYGFLGPNGAGKTTTIRMILSIFEPTSGRISVLGKPSALDVRDQIGYLPEEKGLYKKMKAWSLIAYFGSLKGLASADAKKRAHELLHRYGLGDFADHKCEALSKGMQQKVQVLASIIHEPDFIILDEPFSGLDPVNQEVMEDVIRDLQAKHKTVVFSTHVMAHAERICDRILLISKGKKIFDGTIPEARATIPRRVVIQTTDDVSPLRAVPGVQSVDRHDGPEEGLWEIKLGEGTNPQKVLQVCFQSGINLSRFDRTEPSLHDVFVHLVGPEAREAVLR